MSYQNIIKEKLGTKRYIHSMNVAAMCKDLSDKHGLDPQQSEKAYIAGVLHDIMKQQPDNKLLAMVHESEHDPAEFESPKLWHAIAGAKYVRDELGISDPDIINAIRFHTVGRANMSTVEKIVYLADKISKDRSYNKVEELRTIAFESLDLGLYETIKLGIKKTVKKGAKIPAYTIEAYNFLCTDL